MQVCVSIQRRKGRFSFPSSMVCFPAWKKIVLLIQKTFFPFHNLLLVMLCTFPGLLSSSGKPLSGFFQNTLHLLVRILILNPPRIDETHPSVCHPHPFVGAHYTSYIVLVSSVICVESTQKSVFVLMCPCDPLLCLEWIMKDSRSLCTPAFHTYPSVLGWYCF